MHRPAPRRTPHARRRISLYGHGLLGSRDEVDAGNVEAMATEHNMVFCATDWWGLADGDTPYDITALQNLNQFPAVVDRLQQGVLNTLYLGRLMLNPQGLAANPAFQIRPLIDTSHLYYDGNSQGGIMGGMTTAVAPDFRHAVLGVTGMDYGERARPAQHGLHAVRAAPVRAATPTSRWIPVILDLMQQLWDRGDPDGYAQQMTSTRCPDTPSHTVLMQIAYGDHQVSMYSAAIEARTIGASAHEPALDLNTDRSRDRNLFFGIPAIKRYPFGGSAIVIWDSGPGRVQPPPLANLAPVDNQTTNQDPHEDVRNTVAARTQKSDFLAPERQASSTSAEASRATPTSTRADGIGGGPRGRRRLPVRGARGSRRHLRDLGRAGAVRQLPGQRRSVLEPRRRRRLLEQRRVQGADHHRGAPGDWRSACRSSTTRSRPGTAARAARCRTRSCTPTSTKAAGPTRSSSPGTTFCTGCARRRPTA